MSGEHIILCGTKVVYIEDELEHIELCEHARLVGFCDECDEAAFDAWQDAGRREGYNEN